MRLRTAFTILTIIEASVFAGASLHNEASQQTEGASDISSLVTSVASKEKKSKVAAKEKKSKKDTTKKDKTVAPEAKKDTLIIDWGDDPFIYRKLEENGNLNKQDSIVTEGNIMDILSFLSEEPAVNSENGTSSGESKTVGKKRSKKGKGENGTRKVISSASVLDYMLGACATHDYYQSGHWEAAEDFSYITARMTLPDYDPGDFYRPVAGRVTSLYGYRAMFGRVHKGIDLALNIGDPVRAALPGIVAKVGYDNFGYGHYVVVIHKNGVETRYAHLQQPKASPGDRLNAGDILGLGGNTGNSTGPHLHFEVRYNGNAIDPASIFDSLIKGDNTLSPLPLSSENKKETSPKEKKKETGK